MIGVQTIVAPGIISFHVITPGSTVSKARDTLSGFIFAAPVTVTFPVANVNAFLTAVTLASAVTTIVPRPNDT